MKKIGWTALALALLAGLQLVQAVGQGPAPSLEPPAALSKAAPGGVAELRAIQQHVHKVLEKVMPAVVGVRAGGGSGSGVIVSADGLVLTAGHVSGTPNRNMGVVLPSGKTLKAKALGKNGGIDTGMMKIVEPGKYPFLELGHSSELQPGQWVIAIGHPGGFRPNRTPVVRVGRILSANRQVIRTDCTLVGGDSGGPLFDMQGRVIGIHSRIGDREITQNFHVPVDAFRQGWERLVRGESWGGRLGETLVRSVGGKVLFEKKEALAAADPSDRVQRQCHCKIYPMHLQAGSTYTIDLRGGDKTGKKFDPFLRLETADGKEVAEDDDGGGFPHARIVYKPLRDGDYCIVVTSCDPNQTGDYTLQVQEADVKDTVVAGKVEVLKAIRIPAPAVATLVDKFKAGRLPLHVNAVLIDDKGNPLPGKEVIFQWDRGKETLRSNGEGVVRWALAQDRSKRLSLDLPAGSRALLALTDVDGIIIPLQSGKKDPTVETVKSAGGKIVRTFDGALNRKDPFDPERQKCHRQTVELPMEAGKTYTIDLVSEDFDAFLRLENDAKGKLAEDDDGAGYMNARIVYTPSVSGTYRVVVTTCDPGQVGAYRVTVRESNAK